MCGILAVIGSKKSDIKTRADRASKTLSHRGPDERGLIQTLKGHILCHERLSIVDLHTGHQPIEGTHGAYLIHNGEIYNHEQLRKELKEEHTRRTHSDSEIILHLYEEKGIEAIHDLDGVFAFVIVDGEKVFAGRDPIGVKPLFYGLDDEGVIWFASESKALEKECAEIREFPAGHYYTKESGFVQYYQPTWYKEKTPKFHSGEDLKDKFEEAVRKRLMSDVPLGVLLSGGLDSSLVASIVAREMKKQGKKVMSFSVGMKDEGSDLKPAREVAEFIGTEHHEVNFTFEQGLAVLPEIIQRLETYDITTIRASTPMYIMSKYITDLGVKVVLSGEGSDEIFGGYLYFHNAPSAQDFHEECVRRVQLLHTSDVLRADRSTMGAGLEARVPFLDLDFLDSSMTIDPTLKQGVVGEKMEKHILRKAFDTPEDPYLPESVLWRQKEQFSDGVGYSWIDRLKDHADKMISDELFAQRKELYPHNTPSTKEAFFYRSIFEDIFKHKGLGKLTKKWIPRWQDEDQDPSGRASAHHKSTYHKPVSMAL